MSHKINLESYFKIINRKNNLDLRKSDLDSDLLKILRLHYSKTLDRIRKLQGLDHSTKLKRELS